MKVTSDSALGRAVMSWRPVPASPGGTPIVPRLDRLVHRLTGGRTTISAGMVPMVLLTTTGSRSGSARTVPLACLPEGADLYVVAATSGASAIPLSTNLLHEPRGRVSFDGDEHDVVAHRLTAEEKAQMWPRLVAAWPVYDDYVERSGRELRVFRLDRVTALPDAAG